MTELRSVIIGMVNSTFFVKQIGYIHLLKYWRAYVDSPMSFGYPYFINKTVLEAMTQLIDIEAQKIKEASQRDYLSFEIKIKQEILPILQHKMSSFKSQVFDNMDSFESARKFLLDTISQTGSSRI